MPLDPDIREETYPYFLEEAPELLQALEQGLLDLPNGCSINQINSLMRTTHTLKGAAASMGLETIAIVAHSLEDIFKVLCKPDVVIDPDVAALLFEGYDCLARPIRAEITGSSVNTAEILDRSASIFAQLESRLGACFNQEDYLPTSEELGFDVTQSMFEVGVTQRLNDLAQAIAQHPDKIAATLRIHAEVFFGLAESLSLQGFEAIAAITLTALDQHPEQAVTIAQLALADFQAGCAAVLAGDRTQGGQPSPALQRFAEPVSAIPASATEESQPNWLVEFDTAFAHELEQQQTSELAETGSNLVEVLPQEATLCSTETANTLKPYGVVEFETSNETTATSSDRHADQGLKPLVPQGKCVSPATESITEAAIEKFKVAPINFHEVEITHSEPAQSLSEQTTEATEESEPSASISESSGVDHEFAEKIAVETAAAEAIATDKNSLASPPKTHSHQHRGLCKVFQWIRDAILAQAGIEPNRQPDLSTRSPEVSSTATPVQASADLPLEDLSLKTTVPKAVQESIVQESTTATLPPEPPSELLLEKIWAPVILNELDEPLTVPEAAIASSLFTTPESIAAAREPLQLPPSKQENAAHLQLQPQTTSRTVSATAPIARKKHLRSNQVRVNVEDLDQLNYSVGELLTQQNRQSLQNERLQAEVRLLLKRLNQHQQMLSQLQDRADRQPLQSSSRPQVKTEQATALQTLPLLFGDRFDTLELSHYSDSHLLVQSLLDDTVQLAEAAEAIDLFSQQSSQILEKQQRLLSGTRDALMQARMLPLSEVLNRFPPVLQQLETLHGKRVTLKLHGTGVLVDKAIAEKLYDPLLHLIRNAFDHAIEPVAVRHQQNKPDIGQIEINAHHQGKYLMIEVRDDGKGLDYEQIRQRLVERQLVSPDQADTLSQSHLIDFLFEPGFSTATQVNTLSGRGVGLDVVREQILGLQGLVTVQSTPGQGATFILQIPLSLAIAKLLVCQAGTRTYALTTDAIEQILIPMPEDLRERPECKILHWRKGGSSQLIQIYSIAKLLNYSSFLSGTPSQPAASPPLNHIILIRHQGELVGLEVDQLIGEQELVIRPLGSKLESPNYVQGASVLADGRLTLVVDGGALLQQILNRQAPRTTPAMPSAAVQPPLQTTATLIPISNIEEWEDDKKILIAEDSITVRQTLTLTLQKAGYQVLQAKDGQEALEQLQQHNDVQLVFCDLEMPRMNGFEFLKQRQQFPALANIPVIVLTSRSGEKHRLLTLELGATNYITKPYLEHKLLAMVAAMLQV
jgi:chemotaxis family two-component system sensor histidine kinase/response regulator PixL